MLETIPGIMENALILQLKKEQVDMLTEIKKLSKTYGKNHPVMIRAITAAKVLKIKIE